MFVPIRRQTARVSGKVSVFSASFLSSSSSLAPVGPLLLSDARDLSSLCACVALAVHLLPLATARGDLYGVLLCVPSGLNLLPRP